MFPRETIQSSSKEPAFTKHCAYQAGKVFAQSAVDCIWLEFVVYFKSAVQKVNWRRPRGYYSNILSDTLHSVIFLCLMTAIKTILKEHDRLTSRIPADTVDKACVLPPGCEIEVVFFLIIISWSRKITPAFPKWIQFQQRLQSHGWIHSYHWDFSACYIFGRSRVKM